MPLATTLADRQILGVLSVYDGRDPTAASPELRNQARRSCLEALKSISLRSDDDMANLKGLTIGVPQVGTIKDILRSLLTNV